MLHWTISLLLVRFLFISTENKASRRVAEKCGFKCKDEQLFFADEEGISIMLPWKYVFSEHISKREVMVKKALDNKVIVK